jgi:hypothetical protein
MFYVPICRVLFQNHFQFQLFLSSICLWLRYTATLLFYWLSCQPIALPVTWRASVVPVSLASTLWPLKHVRPCQQQCYCWHSSQDHLKHISLLTMTRWATQPNEKEWIKNSFNFCGFGTGKQFGTKETVTARNLEIMEFHRKC